MAGLLGDVYSAIDTKKRQLKGLLAEPVETVRQFMFNQNQDAGKNLDLLRRTYRGADGKISLANMSPKSQAAHDQLTGDLMAAVMGATVWHGSPHKFDKFDSAKIGTGEGNQAYGHGLYLAESDDVAKTYQASLGRPSSDGLSKAQDIAAWAHTQSIDGVKPADALMQEIARLDSYGKFGSKIKRADYDEALQLVQGGAAPSNGNLYKVDLPDEHIAKMLDWDKPLSQQSPEVQKSIKSASSDMSGTAGYMAQRPEATSVQQLYQALQSQHGSDATNKFFQEMGVPGLKYLDAGSKASGGQTRNYVVFPGNEGLLSILERNGQPLK